MLVGLTEALVQRGFVVSTPEPTGARFVLVMPHQYWGLSDEAFLRALEGVNASHGLPTGSLRAINRTREERGQERDRVRLWVEVSAEGVAHLVTIGHLLHTLTARLRLRPVNRADH